MADKLEGTAIIANTVSGDRIVTGSITTTQLAPSVASFVNAGQPLKIRTITYPGNDTAANTGGGQSIVLTGTGFGQNVQVYINSNAVPSVTRTNANSISFTTPALAAATYPIYVINTDDGATAILIPGIQYSGTPTWTTTTPLTTQDASIAWNIQLVATSDSTVSYSLQAGSSLPAGITLAANGLISGTMSSPPEDETTYNFTVIANDLEQQDSSRAFSVSVTVAVLDPFFTYTTLLLHGDGTNNANNHAFVDSSNNNFSLTRRGNASQGTFNPFGSNWSYYFDGTTDYLTSSYTSANFNWWGTDFTVEAWINPDTLTGWTVVAGDATQTQPALVGNMSPNSATANYWSFGPTAEGRLQFYYYNGSPIYSAISNGRIQAGVWSHIAMTKTSSGITFYINGTKDATVAISGTPQESASYPLTIGSWSSANIKGYVSNLRIIKGTALYTANFTPSSTPIGVVANTTYLTGQSNRFEDKGPLRLAITNTGDVKVSKFDPFKPLKGIPGSYGVYFDGTGDSLTTPNVPAFQFGTGDFTIEMWIYATVTLAGTQRHIFHTGNNGSGQFNLRLNSSGQIFVFANDSGPFSATGSTTLVSNRWYHIAFTRSGSTNRIFVNGVVDSTTTNSYSYSGSGNVSVASWSGDTPNFAGHISNLRVLKGTALYTSAFTPPTTPLTAISNTSFLTCQSTSIIDNSTNGFTITRNGDAIVTDHNPFTTTFVSEKYNTANNGGSIYSDGTNDGLTFPANTALRPGTSDFTIEFWWYPTSAAAGQYIVHQNLGGGGGGYANFLIYGHTSNSLLYYSATTGSWNVQSGMSMGTYILNSWNHIVVSRTSGTLRTFVNGIPGGSFSDSSNLNDTGNIYLGTYDGTNGTFYGYISGFRMRIGTAAGVTQSSIQVAPPTNVANTAALLNFTNAGILDSVGKNVLETVGDARVNTSVKKYGTGSMYFDGTGDFLQIPASRDFEVTGDITIEFWVYWNSIGNIAMLFGWGAGATGKTFAYTYSDGRIGLGINGTNEVASAAGQATTGSWIHLAFVRSGSTTTIYKNGVSIASGTTAVWYASTGTESFYIGGSNSITDLDGYIDDFRITKGVARYRYNFTPPTKAFNDGDGNLATPTSDVLAGDSVNTPMFPYTTLLLHGDGTNNANNNAFVDSSNNNFAITRNGNATQGTFSPFSPTGWSGYFDGTGDYLTVSNNAVLNPGSNNFTIEAWIYPTNLSSVQCIHYKSESDGTGVLFAINNSGAGKVNFYIGTGGAWGLIFDSPAVISPNIWTHVAVTKNGTTHTIWVNGVPVASTTYAGNPVNTNEDLKIGRFRSANAFEFNGYISNYRFVNGTALYTAAFTPSTSAITAVANTTLLTLQSNRFIDNSTNAFTITRNGDVSVQAFSPFPPSVEYTANTHGGSAYFDGSGDYLSVGDQAAFEFGSGDYTIELWWYPTSSTDQNIIGKWDAGGSEWILQWRSAGYYRWASGGSIISDANITLRLNSWNHVAVTKSGTSLRIYSNGVQIGTTATEGTISATGAALTIGAAQINSSPLPVFGYISNLRILKGTAQSTGSTYTVPTTPLTAVANTSLLCNFTNAGILDSTGKLILETVGDVKVNTAIKKFGTGSIAFDGSGDRLTIPFTNDFLELGINGQNFTVEAWIYPTNAMASAGQILSKGGGVASWSTTNGAQYQWGISSSAAYWSWNSSGSALQITNGNVTLNTWQHLAVTYDGTTTRTFLNGVLQATSTSPYTAPTTRNLQYIGMTQSGGFTQEYFGYIDDLRITKGIARYVQNFTPPTAAFLNK